MHTFRHYPEGVDQTQQSQRLWKKVRVLGVDGAYVRGMGKTQPVVVAVDLGDGEPVSVAYVDEYKPQAVKRWLGPLVKQLGVSVIVTDDLVHYKTVVAARRAVAQAAYSIWLAMSGSGHRIEIWKPSVLARLPSILVACPQASTVSSEAAPGSVVPGKYALRSGLAGARIFILFLAVFAALAADPGKSLSRLFDGFRDLVAKLPA